MGFYDFGIAFFCQSGTQVINVYLVVINYRKVNRCIFFTNKENSNNYLYFAVVFWPN